MNITVTDPSELPPEWQYWTETGRQLFCDLTYQFPAMCADVPGRELICAAAALKSDLQELEDAYAAEGRPAMVNGAIHPTRSACRLLRSSLGTTIAALADRNRKLAGERAGGGRGRPPESVRPLERPLNQPIGPADPDFDRADPHNLPDKSALLFGGH